MILPEHREAILAQRQRTKKIRPELDDHQLEENQRIIQESMNNKREIEIQVYGEFEDRRIRGYIVRSDEYHERLLIQKCTGDEWIKISDILYAVLME